MKASNSPFSYYLSQPSIGYCRCTRRPFIGCSFFTLFAFFLLLAALLQPFYFRAVQARTLLSLNTDQSVLQRLEQHGAAEKLQMGSRPPTCDTKCSMCKPCVAVQVPTMPQTSRPISPKITANNNDTDSNKEAAYNLRASAQLKSNYKPEDWKCACGNRFYNP